MGSVIGDILPFAVVIAISPIPIIAAVLMLMSSHAKTASVGFLFGWLVGIVVAVTAFTLLASLLPSGDSDDPHPIRGVIQLLLGAALIVLAVRKWRSRPAPGQDAELPKWMSTIDQVTPPKSFAFGFVFSALNPKNLIMSAAAGVIIGSAALDIGSLIVVIVIYTVLAGISVGLPVIAFLVASERMRRPLDALRVWLVRENAAVMAGVLLVIGVSVLGKGIGSF